MGHTEYNFSNPRHKIVAKRSFDGPNNSPFTSEYYPSKKWAAIILFPKRPGRGPCIAVDIFKTKHEAEEWNPSNGGYTFESQIAAERYFSVMADLIDKKCRSVSRFEEYKVKCKVKSKHKI